MAYALDHIQKRISTFLAGWKQFAKDDSFGGMTLEEFADETKDSLELRDEIKRQETRLVALRVKRDQADRKNMRKMDLVVNGVRGDPKHGDNSTLYASLGYVPKAQRKSGLVRKLKKKKRNG